MLYVCDLISYKRLLINIYIYFSFVHKLLSGPLLCIVLHVNLTAIHVVVVQREKNKIKPYFSSSIVKQTWPHNCMDHISHAGIGI